MELKYNSIFQDGWNQGINQGREDESKRRTVEIISIGLKQNLSLDVISKIANISVDEVKQVIKDNRLDEK